MARSRLAFLLLLAACKTKSAPTEDLAAYSFYAVEVRAPKGTNFGQVDSVLPGPGGLGGLTAGERPTLTLSVPNQKRFYVTITKTQEMGTLEGERFSLSANHVGDQLEGHVTATGWDLTYMSSGRKVYEIHTDVAAQHFNCIYSEDSTSDLAAAEAICRSLRPRS